MIQQDELLSKDYCILTLLNSLIVTYMVLGTLISQKIVTINGFSVSVASIWFSFLTFPITDIMCNEFGKRYARFAVLLGWMAMALTSVLAVLSALMPPAKSFCEHEPTFDYLMMNSIRFLIVVSFSYLIAQILDVYVFSYLKSKTKGKHLWFRNNASTFISQTLNTAIFVFGLFVGSLELSIILKIFITTLLMKVIIAIIDTPFVYLGVYLVRKFRDNTKNT